ncbi:MAG: DUF1571 domain-containing protein [Planctomycetales bacterium]
MQQSEPFGKRSSIPDKSCAPHGRRRLAVLFWCLTLGVACPPLFAADKPAQEEDEADRQPPEIQDVIDFAEASREALKGVQDYTAVFSKVEIVGRRKIEQQMQIKIREKPFSVYLRYLTGPEAGREVLYVAGANNGNLLVHEVGIKAVAGTVPLPPTDRKVMEENRHPITQIGMSNLLTTAFKIWDVEKKYDPQTVDIKFFPNAKLAGTACDAVQITHQKQQRDLPFHMSRVYFDKELKLPVRAERYAWPQRKGEQPPLVESYTYSKIKTNVGLTDQDFSPRNPQYGFRR